MKLVFLIRSLSRGGAERQLTVLARGLSRLGHNVVVAVFYGGGSLEARLADSGVDVFDLGKRGRWDNLRPFTRFLALLRQESPDVVHGYMDVANIQCLGARLVSPNTSIVWGIRSSGMDHSDYGLLRRTTTLAESHLSGLPDLVIANSHSGRNHCLKRGYPPNRTVTVPNGIETDRFRPNEAAGARIRDSWDLPTQPFLIGHVARLDPKKDHETLLRAMAEVGEDIPGWHLVTVGADASSCQDELRALASDLRIDDQITWRGSEGDMPSIYNAFDILISSSAYGEGFPNVLGEAMACGVPCVTTDVGDSARIVGDSGVVVPPRQPDRLADGVRRTMERLAEHPTRIRRRARNRIVREFRAELLVSRTNDELKAL